MAALLPALPLASGQSMHRFSGEGKIELSAAGSTLIPALTPLGSIRSITI